MKEKPKREDIFENNISGIWLDEKSKELVNKIGNHESLSSEEVIILVLKAQSSHFHHLDKDLFRIFPNYFG
ncbi:MAG: hypothetical protein ACLFOC_05755 [Campylobacterales bacterium]